MISKEAKKLVFFLLRTVARGPILRDLSYTCTYLEISAGAICRNFWIDLLNHKRLWPNLNIFSLTPSYQDYDV